MRLEIMLFMDNTAFEDNPNEAGRILRKLADRIEPLEPFSANVKLNHSGTLYDLNDNSTGYWKTTNSPDKS